MGEMNAPMDVGDYINATIYSMLRDCTDDSQRRHKLEMTQEYILCLQQEVRGLQCKLQAQTVRYEKAKGEASMNANALKISIATCERLREQLGRLMGKELACNVRQAESLENTELQLGGSSSRDQSMDVYGDDNMRPKELAASGGLDTSEGPEVG